MYDKIVSGYYNVIMPYPKKEKKRCTNTVCHFICSKKQENFKLCPMCGSELTKPNLNYKEDIKKYRDKQNKLHLEFSKDLLSEFGLTDHPKAKNIFNYVWGLGHSNGYLEVYNCLNELIDYEVV